MIVRPLTEYCTLNMGQSPDSKTYNTQGKGLPFYQGNADFGETHPITRVWCSTPVKVAEEGDILISVRAPIGAMNMAVERCCIGRGLAALTPIRNKCSKQFLYYALQSKVDSLIAQGTGSTFKAISKKVLEATRIPAYSTIEQEQIAETIGHVDNTIAARRKQLALLDQLVKSRFIELFGDPVRNSMGLPTEPMTTVCAIIDGDRGKNYPKQDDFSDTGYCLFLNAKNVTATGFSFENRMFITKEKDNALHNGKLERGDVVLTTRGTLGNLAFYDDSVPFENVRINSGMVILRMNKSVMTEVFFMEQFKLQLQSIKGKIASGSAQPQLPISTMNKIRILLAPMALQEQFAAFVEQVDKSKVAVQKALDEAQLLFDSLMQKYFG